MTKLSEKKRDAAKCLLEEHQAVCDALRNHGKSGFETTIFINKEDDNDSTTVFLNYQIAKKAMTDQKTFLERELAKLEIEIEK
jgi:hypothetical protein